MLDTTLCYVALGSNLENPKMQLEIALANLKKIPETELLKISSFYSSKPWNNLPHPNYLNAVCSLQTRLSAKILFEQLQQIESQQGRMRQANEIIPRTIDLDLLLYGEEIINSAELVVPHPRMKLRDFVLIPLAELEPSLQLPDGSTIVDLINQLTEKTLFF